MDEPFFALRVRGTVEDVEGLLDAVRERAEAHDVFLQPVDEAVVYDEAHARSAYVHAARAVAEGRAASRTVEGEFLRYLTGRRQVGKAIEAGGVKAGAGAFVLVAAGARAGTAVWGLLDRMGWSRDPAGVGRRSEALDRLGITEDERDTLPADRWGELALERVALMDLERK